MDLNVKHMIKNQLVRSDIADKKMLEAIENVPGWAEYMLDEEYLSQEQYDRMDNICKYCNVDPSTSPSDPDPLPTGSECFSDEECASGYCEVSTMGGSAMGMCY